MPARFERTATTGSRRSVAACGTGLAAAGREQATRDAAARGLPHRAPRLCTSPPWPALAALAGPVCGLVWTDRAGGATCWGPALGGSTPAGSQPASGGQKGPSRVFRNFAFGADSSISVSKPTAAQTAPRGRAYTALVGALRGVARRGRGRLGYLCRGPSGRGQEAPPRTGAAWRGGAGRCTVAESSTPRGSSKHPAGTPWWSISTPIIKVRCFLGPA